MKQVDYSKCKTLEEMSTQTLNGLSRVYDYDFTEYLRKMPEYLTMCSSYRELGTNQGGSASIALLSNLNYYEFVDKSFKNYRKQKHLFNNYLEHKNIKITMHEMSSLEVNTDTVTDFLLVDSVHKYKHVKKEIETYAPLTSKYIMFHDTNGVPEVYRAVKEFLEVSLQWQEIEHYSQGAGYTVIQRI